METGLISMIGATILAGSVSIWAVTSDLNFNKKVDPPIPEHRTMMKLAFGVAECMDSTTQVQNLGDMALMQYGEFLIVVVEPKGRDLMLEPNSIRLE